MSESYKKYLAAALALAFTATFLYNLKSDLPLVFEKDLRAHDESSNSVVAANLTREFFPPRVRINPLDEQQGNWMEGPFWQHIPPLFAYVPYIFFKLDGQITIEVKRLSYAFLILIAGWMFIWGVYLYRKRILHTAAAAAAVILWAHTPFTRALVTGYAFGVSDIVLACSVAAAFLGILWYFSKEKLARLDYPWTKIGSIALLCALPILAKNLLGAIPGATYFLILIYDHRGWSKKIWIALVTFLGALTVYYLPLYLASPATFRQEILVAFFHFGNLEGWGRPWHYYLSKYLPHAYLFHWTYAYFTVLAWAVVFSFQKNLDRRTKVLLRLSLIWFAWNLLAVSLVESKIANFIFQTYLLSLLAICLGLILPLEKFRLNLRLTYPKPLAITLMLLVLFGTMVEATDFRRALGMERGNRYVYDTEREKFYQAAEDMQKAGLDTGDLVVMRVSDNDCWFRYPILFLTGSEAKTLLEMNFNQDLWPQIKSKYRRLFVILADQKLPDTDIAYATRQFGEYHAFEFDLDPLSQAQVGEVLGGLVTQYKSDTAADIARIKADKTACQWLVPDSILNAP